MKTKNLYIIGLVCICIIGIVGAETIITDEQITVGNSVITTSDITISGNSVLTEGDATAGSGYAISVCPSGSAETCNFTCDGVNDELQINQAIDSVSASGGFVYLRAGDFTIDAQITIDHNDITLQGEGMHSTRLIQSYSGNVIELGAYDYITIKDLEIDCASRAYSNTEVIDGDGCDWLTVENIYMHHHGGSYGLEIVNANNTKILDSRWEHIGGNGDGDAISLAIDCWNAEVSGNYFNGMIYEDNGEALDIQDGSGLVIVTNNIVENCRSGFHFTSHSGYAGNTIFICSDNIFRNLYRCAASSGADAIYFLTTDGTATKFICTGNIIEGLNTDSHSDTVTAIKVSNANDFVIANNIIDNKIVSQSAGDYGISVGTYGACDVGIITGNVVKNCYKSGIVLRNNANTNITITDNICTDNEYGINVTNGDYLIIHQNNCVGNSIDGVNVTAGQNTNGIVGDNLE